MRRIGKIIALALIMGSPMGMAIGDTLLVESVRANTGIERPSGGMNMDSVLEHYGEPASRYGPVGDPPISTWDYGDFLVYFEYQTVIHSVVAHK